MTYRTSSAFIFIILICLKFPGPSLAWKSAQHQDDPLLTIGGRPVDKDELIYLISKGKTTNENGIKGMSREEFDENLDMFINYKLKIREAEALGLDKTEEFYLEFESFKENLKAPFLIKNSLEEGELRKAYTRMQEVVRASHILLQFPPKATKDDSLIVLKMALKLRDQIQNGENINELAVEHSDDPSARINKGDLGYFTALQMVQPFEDAAFTLSPGQVSDPVLTNFGYHIIKVQDRLTNPGNVKVSHILVRIDQDKPNGEDLAKRKVADIYVEIQKESTVWEDIVRNYSEDPASSQKGGILPWFSVGSMIPEFEMTAFSLTEIGEVSTPVRTQYGYHILRLEDKKPLDSFEVMEETIRSRILRDSRSTMIQSQVMAIQKSRYSFDENEMAIARLKAELNGVTKSTFSQVLKEKGLESEPLFTLNGKTYRAKDLASFMENEEITLKSKASVFDTWYERYAAKHLNEAEEADLSVNNKEYKMLLNEYRDGILLFSLMNEQVWQKGITDTVGQRSFYQKNISSYQWKNRVDAYIVKILDRTKLESARTTLSGKSLDEQLVMKFDSSYQASSPLAFDTERGLFEYADHPVLSQAKLNQKYQEIEVDGDLYIILLGEDVSAGPKQFADTRGIVIRDYQEYLDATLIENLKRKYPIQVSSKVKEEAFVALNQ